ncbi:hypothetical protein [Corynebacterium terpenotabidum]|uniref:Uncharacterized protein n=1 Tax=Corynebacterium terpenotabidum Y-11 TaxID=1200352 RepID=S4XLP5_9CORY|nr:hypothetical protein [Corynebacterium terpenotabidum]AGP31508.1 hypothetical protein A606_09345 [Corynebacterium terpenotabidum Y-11]
MTTSQQQVDVSLGTLAATAQETGCPPEPVGQMCDSAAFTCGLDTVAVGLPDLAGAVGGSGTGLTELVAGAAGAVQGLGGGVPSRELCDAGDALVAQDCLCQTAVSSVDSCLGAVDQLITGCAEEIGALVDEVCGLAGQAVACGSGEMAAEVVQGAVETVTGMLDQRNCGLEGLMDISIGDCLPAAGLVAGVGAVALGGVAVAGLVDAAVSADCPTPESDPGQVPECPAPEQVQDAGCPDPEPDPEPDPVPDEPPVSDTTSGSVDPVHGFDKSDRVPQAEAAPTVQPAAVGDPAPAEPESADTPDDGWNPDIWLTGSTGSAGSAGSSAPETAGDW